MSAGATETAAGAPHGATVENVSVLVPIGNGSEEIETVTIQDVLVRAGAKVTVASVMPELVCTMSRGLKVQADVLIEDVKNETFDMIILPGGMPGAENLQKSTVLKSMLEAQNQRKARIGAICAAPAVVLAAHGLLNDHKATCFPAAHFLEKLPHPVDEDDTPVVVSENFTTSRGPGTAMNFALSLVEQVFGSAKALELAGTMMVDPNESW
eukprot:CAMPEP_0182443498 /NCGR_PEP_ID=MMETSP1172-20130603/2210_1 /TAXON_ID=708627 /ORGANISM="Timspurckia oligopyrenoides, Strain CCMP3278" /LENGTH=210 /DNA_ID=CAMNT_0024638803 /DNA_START=274 /DNA_END=906 /DNA_ORIENTATION=-